MLAKLQIRSSQHWGYPPDFFDWAPGAYNIPATYVRDYPVYLLDEGGTVTGFYGLTSTPDGLLLDKLFVDLAVIGTGRGKLLWRHAVNTARDLGTPTLIIGSDPNAAPFYRAMGAEWTGEKPTPSPLWTVQMFAYAIPPLTFRLARPEDAEGLHALTGRSSLHWGYEPEFLEWEPEAIAVTPEFLAGATTWILEDDGQVVGYYALVQKPHSLYLDKLFVEPEWIGTGGGRRLWEHAMATARDLGAVEVVFDADPNAASFYRAMGAEWLSETETSRPGWNLQQFRYRVPGA